MSMKTYPLSGIWKARIDDNIEYEMMIPGTLDESKIGHKDVGANQWHPDADLGNAGNEFDENAPISTRFTRKYTYEGAATIEKNIEYTPSSGHRVFVDVERARVLSLCIDGREAPEYTRSSLSTPYTFEVTGMLNGHNNLAFISDNSYPGLPHDAIVYSSAATDETQTNWNGLLGIVQIREENFAFIEKLHVFNHNGSLTLKLYIDSDREFCGEVSLECPVFEAPISKSIQVNKGKTRIEINDVPYKKDTLLWDEYEGNLYSMCATLKLNGDIPLLVDSKTITFGIRDFSCNEEGRFTLNGRVIFLRSEANCAEFPEAGHPPMTKDEWISILEKYKSYGVNYMRFHSHCPPEAAFAAADELGMLMQPELSHWNPKNAFEDELSYSYYERELNAIVDTYANHPSFVALTLGNELQADEFGIKRMRQLVNNIKAVDSTRMYAIGSNEFYGAKGCDEASDFYASQMYFEHPIRGCFCNMEGYINNKYPDAKSDFNDTMTEIRKNNNKPVLTFEVGQYEILPDFDELSMFQGISDPANYKLIKEKVEQRGLLPLWKKYVEATGELSLIGYREEVEAVLRTPGISGISLLGLQDFPGQGTALVGMMNSHLMPKPFDFARPKRFSAFFRAQLPLVMLKKYTYENTEFLSAKVQLANYGKSDVTGAVSYSLTDRSTGELIAFTAPGEGILAPMGHLSEIGEVRFDLSNIEKASALMLKATISDMLSGDMITENSYPVWVYPHTNPVCPANVYETEHLDDTAISTLAKGGRVYLNPKSTSAALPKSIKGQFTTDFWSVGTFAGQEGGMGQLIDESHPIFKNFPTKSHTEWQWWLMAGRRAVILPKNYKAIITEMDSYAYLRPMAQLIEFNCGGGKLLFSTLELNSLYDYPEARALQSAIYTYLASEEFNPPQEISLNEMKPLVN